jgi:ATP-dependent helicase/nuclease subunit B
MASFINDVLKDLQSKNVNLSDITIILPSKRAGVFLKNELSQVVNKTLFSPKILSIEDFVEDLSQLKTISNTELLFEFYHSYRALSTSSEIESFEQFSKWGQILLQDFNEIDRYLIPQKDIFSYLSAIQDLTHWSLDSNKTDFVKNYLSFWNKLLEYYSHFTEQLLNQKTGYQGLIYRKAAENIESYIKNNPKTNHVFLGFNALNTAEEIIIQALLESGWAKIYWDIDAQFINNPIHDAGLFTRTHKKNWPFFKNNPFNWIGQNYSNQKNISIYGIPKNIGQAKYIGSILNTIQSSKNTLDSTAVILGDESLLIPVLNSIPKKITALNITMGFPLKSIPLASLFENLFYLHKKQNDSFYYKDIINIISHPFIRPLFHKRGKDYAAQIIDTIKSDNLIYLSINRLKDLAENKQNALIEMLFLKWNKNITETLENCSNLILIIKSHLDEKKSSNLLSLEYLYRFNELFNELIRLNSTYNYIKDISTLYSIYKELVNTETLDFKGEPLQGLQIMGMLESRVLDFETIIISSVNEGILPAGKSNNSFIPFDVKLEKKLPTYKEKDAVYTYHFYRLLQRAKNIHILYNTEADVLTGGEKSRFITQLEIEGKHQLTNKVITPAVPKLIQDPITIEKTPEVIDIIKNVAEKGFSPSSLTNYIRNPIDFYYQKILKIKEYDDAEETVASNTLGTVIHNTLEDFYQPLINTVLTIEHIQSMKSNIDKTVTHHFKSVYKEGDISKGKNLIVFEIAKRYIANFLNLEISDIKAGNQIKIIDIERDSSISLNISELDFPIKINGKVDRVDSYNGITRIIDYKTGKVLQNEVEIIDWEDITSDYKKYSKSFQILTYVLMMLESKQIQLPVKAGIISFKNLKSSILQFSKKDKPGQYAKKNNDISAETLDYFKKELTNLIIEICNPDIPFIEKET